MQSWSSLPAPIIFICAERRPNSLLLLLRLIQYFQHLQLDEVSFEIPSSPSPCKQPAYVTYLELSCGVGASWAGSGGGERAAAGGVGSRTRPADDRGRRRRRTSVNRLEVASKLRSSKSSFRLESNNKFSLLPRSPTILDQRTKTRDRGKNGL